MKVDMQHQSVGKMQKEKGRASLYSQIPVELLQVVIRG